MFPNRYFCVYLRQIIKQRLQMKKHICLLILGIICLSQNAFADSLSGHIHNEDGDSLSYATVYIEQLKYGVMADINGNYRIDNIKPGKYDVIVSFLGYKSTQHGIEIDGNATLDIALKEETVTLDEFVVLPKGMDFGTYIMNQVQKNIKPLGKRIKGYDCLVNARLNKKIDLTEMPKRGLIRFAMMLMGYKKVWDIMVKYPELSLKVAEEVHFNKGKVKGEDLQLLGYSPEMTEKEIKAIKKKDWFLDANPYDRFYQEVDKKIDQLKSKKSKYHLNYLGSYEEGDKQIHILMYGHTRVEIVDGCWQIRRMQYKARTRTIYFEFHEMQPGVYLPISGHAQFNLDYAKYPKGEIGLAFSYDYKSVR